MLLITLTLQPSFDLWTDPMREALNYRKQGDAAFRAKDFQKATSSYTQVRDTDLAIENFIIASVIKFIDLVESITDIK